MAKQQSGVVSRRNIIPTAIAGAGGAGVGYLTGRTAVSAAATTASKLADALIKSSSLSTSGPIVASAILGAALILAAIAIPLSIAWGIKREDQQYGSEEDEDTAIH